MKIALQLSGQPRGYEKAYEYLHKNFLQHYDVDVFFHTWRQNVYSIEKIRDCYDPVSGEITSPLGSSTSEEMMNSRYTNTPNVNSWPPSATYSSFFSIWAANNLRVRHEISLGIAYDYVMRTRFDFALNVDMSEIFDGLKPVMDSGSIVAPSDRGIDNPFFCNDQWAFGSGQAITEYCATYTHIPYFYAKGVPFMGEDLLGANLKRMRGNHRIALMDMKHPFPPGLYNGSYHSLVRDDMELWKTQN
jgi:hypothetical protein